MKREVSSAKRQIFDPVVLTISLRYDTNSVGPKIGRWGTPASIETQCDVVPGSTTICHMFER